MSQACQRWRRTAAISNRRRVMANAPGIGISIGDSGCSISVNERSAGAAAPLLVNSAGTDAMPARRRSWPQHCIRRHPVAYRTCSGSCFHRYPVGSGASISNITSSACRSLASTRADLYCWANLRAREQAVHNYPHFALHRNIRSASAQNGPQQHCLNGSSLSVTRRTPGFSAPGLAPPPNHCEL